MDLGLSLVTKTDNATKTVIANTISIPASPPKAEPPIAEWDASSMDFVEWTPSQHVVVQAVEAFYAEPFEPEPTVYSLGDVFEGTRVIMTHLGIDIGTKTIVVAYRDADDNIKFISEINGYWPFENGTKFIENMLNDDKKPRSDGTKRAAKWIKLDSGKIIVLGRDAQEFAYAKNDTLLRPMAEGGISSDEEAMTVLSSIVQGLIEMAEHEIGHFDDTVKICYCTTANGVNKDLNIEYHKRVIDIILDGYETKSKLSYENIKESHAIVLNMSPDGTGIGISWGAGTVTVSYVLMGIEQYSFSWIGSGDWIDTQVAERHGYSVSASKFKSKSKETPTTVCKRKESIDLTPGKEPADRVGMDIVLHYDVLIDQVLDGIIHGLAENEANARIEDELSIYMAGGVSSPKGFATRFVNKLETRELPFTVKEVQRSEKPLLCVAEGCLKAAESF